MVELFSKPLRQDDTRNGRTSIEGRVVSLARHHFNVRYFLFPDSLDSTLPLSLQGSRDRVILNRDVRDAALFSRKMVGHRQEVCGLEWSPDNQYLASGLT